MAASSHFFFSCIQEAYRVEAKLHQVTTQVYLASVQALCDG